MINNRFNPGINFGAGPKIKLADEKKIMQAAFNNQTIVKSYIERIARLVPESKEEKLIEKLEPVLQEGSGDIFVKVDDMNLSSSFKPDKAVQQYMKRVISFLPQRIVEKASEASQVQIPSPVIVKAQELKGENPVYKTTYDAGKSTQEYILRIKNLTQKASNTAVYE